MKSDQSEVSRSKKQDDFLIFFIAFDVKKNFKLAFSKKGPTTRKWEYDNTSDKSNLINHHAALMVHKPSKLGVEGCNAPHQQNNKPNDIAPENGFGHGD